MAKKGLRGFKNVQLIYVESNTIDEYVVGTSFRMPVIQEMTREVDASEEKVYGDDDIYVVIQDSNGEDVELLVAELSHEIMGKMGLGQYDSSSGEFSLYSSARNLEFAMTFETELVGGDYRFHKIFSFTPTSATPAEGYKTKGINTSVIPYMVKGTIAKRKKDDIVHVELDVPKSEYIAKKQWLNSIT